MKPARLPPRTRRRHPQAGVSLVEMMVAVTIGLFIALALAVVFVNLKGAFTAQDGLAQLQDNERMALGVLTGSVEQAGYFPNPLTDTACGDLPASTLANAATLQQCQAVMGTTGVAPASDTLVTRYAAASGSALVNCLGASNTSGATLPPMTNLFTVDANNELVCSTDGGQTYTPLVAGVSGLSILYGVDSTGSGSVTTYACAAAVSAASWWLKVRTARITVTFLNPYAGQLGSAPPIRWVHTVKLMNAS
jgi:type IV pilus assembly protein PilW